MKNYLIWIFTTIIFIVISLYVIINYANRPDNNEKTLDAEISEIKIANLDDFLLETPDIIIWFYSSQDDDLTKELINFFNEKNIIQEIVYLNINNFEEEDIE